MLLTPREQQEINELARQFEAATGAQAVAAVIGRADDYPDVTWKAFALGAGLAAAAVVADEFIRPDWASIHKPWLDITTVLGCGALFALVAAFVPPVARLFLDKVRGAAEVRQYAEGLFLKRELFRTAERVGLLIMVCRFERRVYILPDTGIAHALGQEDLDAAIAAMAPSLRAWRPAQAFRAGFDALAATLKRKSFRPGAHGNELADGMVVEDGAA
jgi:putative membrane protein